MSTKILPSQFLKVRALANKIVVGFSIFTAVCLVLFVVLNFISNCDVSANKQSSFFGYKLWAVTDDSMAPKYVPGNAVTIKYTSADNLKVGDVILVKQNDTSTLLKISLLEKDKILYDIEATSNKSEFPRVVEEKDIVGKVTGNSWILGILLPMANFLNLPVVFVIIPVILLALLLIAQLLISIIYKHLKPYIKNSDK